MPHKILYITCFPNAKGGGQISLLLLLERLNRKEFQPIVLVPAEGEVAGRARELGCEAWALPIPRLRHIWQVWSFVKKLRAYLLREGISLIHTDEPRATLYAAIARRGTGVRLLWHVRIELSDFLDHILERNVDRLILVARALSRRFSKTGRDRSVVIYNGVDLSEAPPRDEGPLLPSGSPLLVCPARVHPPKGQLVLMEAVSKIVHDFPNLVVWFVGEIDEKFRQTLVLRAQEMGPRASIHFLGFRRDLRSVFSRADLIVFPSLNEAFPRVILEAMAAGKAVIASRVGGIPEMVDDGVTGLLVPPNDPAALANAISDLLRNSVRKRDMEVAAGMQAQKFPLSRTVDAVESLYAEYLKS